MPLLSNAGVMAVGPGSAAPITGRRPHGTASKKISTGSFPLPNFVLQAGCGGFTEQRKRKCHEARGLISKTNEVSCSYWSLDGGQSATMHDIF
ncbi:hypothetical protein M431DRAFT_511218 [Trichoderma harzianum CBS 226.95]|uniref:Uncharacterized protein n=1 Tax=Trichoderma harzianum CBS 226.95 TaxID=983964 RepID=A0A2T4A204_TRIHA|nr:hypothetical protein M431DRAFT_511218 [Trichoderma harzianum CBS 226.95]PTB51095.1 hypothetical protein M431DRAFT_511218 [Trichoderma harzianum CBS 226.95]